jgi:hypothetical protein
MLNCHVYSVDLSYLVWSHTNTVNLNGEAKSLKAAIFYIQNIGYILVTKLTRKKMFNGRSLHMPVLCIFISY